MESSESALLVPKDRRYKALGDLRVIPDELICSILDSLTPRDVARLSCVSSVMYILCNEEPLWMTLCLKDARGQFQYKGSWKKTALHRQGVPDELIESCRKPLHFDGFNSLFLYRRLYRCFTSLGAYSFDKGHLERKKNLSLEEFHHEYDVQKPVMLTELAENWPARSTWTIDQLLHNYGDTAFKISQRSSKKITMKFKDYVSYIELQHDEDPLYIFDDKFGEVAPGLLNDYSVPHLFQEDFFDVLDVDQRPPFRWLIIGPERSGASWHVDPGLTSAWNTLLCGRKRWALYPPGRVPLGVTVHESEEDGDINVEGPTSLQWWLDFYPLLADQDKPIECTQLPGETIFVPSGWWHCVLNLETTVAVTQNFVNSKNFEYVCLDMAPGHRHKGLCRAGLLAVDEDSFVNAKKNASCDTELLNYSTMDEKEKRLKFSEACDDPHVNDENNTTNGYPECHNVAEDKGFTYDISFLSMFLDEERDHYNSIWSPSNSIGQRELRHWLHKLWLTKPEMRELIWKGACLALNVDKWSTRMAAICALNNFPSPSDDERFPVGTGSNPVYLTADRVIKICVEGGLESSIYGLGTELEFYNLLHKVGSPLKDHVPDVLACGILFHENGSYKTVPWDGKGVPDVIAKCNLIAGENAAGDFPFGVWSKTKFDCRKAGEPTNESISSVGCSVWPYIITTRCKGDIFAHLRDTLSWDDNLTLASFLGEQLRNLHLLPLPPLHSFMDCNNNQKMGSKPYLVNGSVEADIKRFSIPKEWEVFINTMTKRKKDVSSTLTKWGDPIPRSLIEKVEEYIPDDLSMLLGPSKDENGLYKICKSPAWIHSDIMDDNVHMLPCSPSDGSYENPPDANLKVNDLTNGSTGSRKRKWIPSHILDFSDLSIGDPLLDVIPMHLDIFRGHSSLLKQFLESYRLPFLRRKLSHEPVKSGDRFGRLSYHAMCYCILHQENILGAIFGLWKELRTAKSWEEVEEAVWGDLNKYEDSVDYSLQSPEVA
ncbi:F-box domain [Macleaya cordata]|uniref:F-box domain n=1 Tax=Macleaya cordata TaxID=56857 RepID=A0A200PN24_MACCD|nr:F-box domain [Macleaya cordata]